MNTIAKHRIVHPLGYVEFATLAEATAYRDLHHLGCEIVVVEEQLPE